MHAGDEEQAFLRAVRDHPDDEVPRLAYADWLDEHGDPSRAEFIRLQCALARGDYEGLNYGYSGRDAMEAREERLLRAHTEWARPLRDVGATNVHWERGFPAAADMYFADFTRNAEQLFRLAPLQSLWIDLGYDRLAGIRALAESPHLTKLKGLELYANGIRDEEIRVLAASSYMANITSLELGSNCIGDEGARALAASPHLSNVRELNLRKNQVGEGGTLALAASPNLTKLTKLDLRCNCIGGRLLREIARTLAGRDVASQGQGRPLV